jgi:hypothetical protein
LSGRRQIHVPYVTGVWNDREVFCDSLLDL